MEKLALLLKNYAWSCVDSCSDYKYIKNFKILNKTSFLSLYGKVSSFIKNYA